MNKISFLDELVKLGTATRIFKLAYGGGTSDTNDVPHGLMSAEPVPESIKVVPEESATRLLRTAHIPPAVQSGNLGGVTQAKKPIDQARYNRAYGKYR